MKNNKGFSLVELIVVIAIMAILAAVAVVGVSVYIPKAQQANDEQLVSDIEYAFEMNAYDYPDGAADFVILTTEGAHAKDGGFADEALTSMFGANWNTELKLHYDEWTVNNSMLNSALNASNVKDSTYLEKSSVSDLLGNVQEVTSAAAGLLGEVAKTETEYLAALQGAMGTAYMDNAVEAGIIGWDETTQKYKLLEGTFTKTGDIITPTQDLQNQLSNLMVFGVADQMKEVEPEDMAELMISGFDDEAQVPQGVYDTGTIMAAQYAMYKAYALDKGGAVLTDFEAMNTGLSNATKMDDVEDALGGFVNKYGDDLLVYSRENEGAVLMNNASAVTQIMNGVNATASDYNNKDALSASGLFTSSLIENDMNTFVGMASVELSPAQKAELQNVLSSHPNAVVVLYNNGKIIVTIE